MILVTGATGLVGSHLVLHLIKKGETVRAIYRDKDSISYTESVFACYNDLHVFGQINWVQADILDVPALENAFVDVDHVYHCAAHISFNREDEEKLRQTNITGTANVTNLAIAFGVKKLCFVSSIAALGNLKNSESIITEETEWNPEVHHSDYAITKYGAEMEIWRAQQEGLKTVIVNPGIIIGPVICGKEAHGSAAILTNIKNEMPFYTKGSSAFVAVTDVVNCMYLLMQSEISGERFAVFEDNYNFRDFANMVADEFHVRRPYKYASPMLTAIAWRVDNLLGKFGRKRLLYKDMSLALHSSEKYSNQKIKKALNYSFVDMQHYIAQISQSKKIS